MKPKCPKCGFEINPAAMLASMTSDAKKKSSAENGKLGGRPKKEKRWSTSRAKKKGER